MRGCPEEKIPFLFLVNHPSVHESHESQQLRNDIKENLAVDPTCIDRIE